MSDNNRLELDIVAHDDTGPATAKVRANFRSVEQDAAKAAAGMSKGFDAEAVSMGRSIDRATASAMRSLDALEKRAALAGKSAVEKLVIDRNRLIGSLGSDEAAIQRAMASYDKLISARQKYEERMAKLDGGGGHGSGNQALRRGILGVKDFLEGSTRGAIIEGTDILVGTSGSGGILQKAIPQIGEITGLSNGAVIAVGGLAAAFGVLGFAGIESMKKLSEVGEEIHNFSIRTGIAPTRVQAFQFAASATGQDPAIFERMTRGLAQASEDDSASGVKARKELDQLGVSLYDRFGDLKPTEQIILDLADGLNRLPPGLERSASSMEIFKRIGVEAIPVLEGLRKNLATSDEIGNTFSEHDLAMMERWNDSLKRMGEEFKRFKLQVEVPLGILGEVTLKGIKFLGIPSGGIGVGGSYAAQLGEAINSRLFQQGEITPPAADPDALRKIAEKGLADNERSKFLALQRQDPAFRLSEERKKLSEYQALAQHGSVDDVQKAEDQFRLVKGLEQKNGSNAALEGVVAARKEQLQLNAQYAEIQQSSQQKLLSASINSSRELSSPEDIAQQLRLAEQRVQAEQQKILNDRRYKVDEKTGTIRDLSGTADYRQFQAAEAANLPLRLRNEYAKVLGDIEAQDAKYFRSRTDADSKAWEQAWQRRKNGELQLQQEEINTRQQIQTRQFDIDASGVDRQREMALQSLDGVNAQTLQEKIALEDRKLAIEQIYAERSLGVQVSKLQNQQALEIAEIQKKAAESGNAGSEAEAADIQATRDKYQQQIDAARGATTDREVIDAQKAQGAKEKLQIESNRKVYDSLKHDAEGLFDQMVYHTKSWGDFAKDMFKATILTPVKEIFSSQVAALFTKGLTGQDVSFGEVGNGQGTFGKLGSIFGRAGLGQPKFGDSNHALAKLNAPNHLGDVSLVSGAVPVVLMNGNGNGGSQSPSQHIGSAGGGGFSFGSLAAGFGLGGLFGGGAAATPAAAAAGESVTSTITYAGGGSETFGGLANLVGGPGGTSGFAGPVAGYGGNSGSGGFLSKIGNLFGLGGGSGSGNSGGGGILSKIGGLFGLGGGSGGGGEVFDGLGGLSGLSSSGGGILGMLGGMGGMLGLPLMMGGLMKGGTSGGVMGIAGGALSGLMVAGPWGAIAGAAIGGARLLGEKLGWITTDRKHAKDLVKQVYGMDINNATADQIVQIAKQGYGGQIDVAVRSQQVRDLLKLYAQTTGQKGAEDKFAQDSVHSASFVESNGKLFQNAVYDNGNAYSYSSPLATYGGVNTSPLSTYAPNNGFNGNLSISLNGQAASDVLAGQVVKVATPGFVQGQALAASNSSNGRTAQQNMTLSPSALAR